MMESARLFTHQMRTSDEPSWARLRELLSEKRIDVNQAAIGDRFSESQGDFVVLVTRDARVYTFLFIPGSQGDILQRDRDTTVSEWREESTEEDRFPYRGEIAAGLDLLAEENTS